jgi:RNA polymerase-interacting CarD/CdnL/TRCF family regulator
MPQHEELFMQLKVGDSVVHPVYGVGNIVKIEEKRFSEKEKLLYYKVALSKNTIWIPVEAQTTIGLRLVTAKSDLDQYRDLLKSPPAPIPKDHNQRHRKQVNHPKQVSFQVVCEVVRDLSAWNLRKPLGREDKGTLMKTRERLYQEWAIAAGLPITEATKEIDALLQTT